jgi:hypothetical protein
MAVHRLPRATKDLDLWVRPAAENAHQVLHALDAFGLILNKRTVGRPQDLVDADLLESS